MSNITQKWVNVLVPFTAGYGQLIGESELARLSKIPQQTASRYLNALVEENVLEYKTQGRNKMFFLNPAKQATYTLLQLIENSKALQFQLGQKEAAVIINEILLHAEAVLLFGSYASGTADEQSDLDLAILGKTDMQKIKKTKRKYTVEVNEHYLSYAELRQTMADKKPLALELMKKHILFGNTSRVIRIFMEASS